MHPITQHQRANHPIADLYCQAEHGQLAQAVARGRSGPPTIHKWSARKLRTAALLALSAPVLACALMASPANAQAGPDLGSQLTDGATMAPGQYLQSPNGQYTLWMQTDGNLVEYNAAGTPLWAPPPPSTTYGHSGAYAVLQGDGNFVVYPPSGAALWASYTQNNPGDHLNLQDDGNLVIYSAAGAPLWATMSGTDPRGATTTGNYYPGGQCTWYAEQEAAQYTGLWLKSFGNAMYWAANAAASGWAVGATPRIGSVIVFQPGVDFADSVGHVAFVTNYYPSTGQVVISEMHFPIAGQVDTRTITNGINNPGIRYIYLNP